jgi:hypothetical protein
VPSLSMPFAFHAGLGISSTSGVNSETIMPVEQEEFWRLIDTIDNPPDDDDFERLSEGLAASPVADIIDFEDRLAALLYALDSRAHARAARARGDWFRYVRCAAVAAGRSVYGVSDVPGLGRSSNAAPHRASRRAGRRWSR